LRAVPCAILSFVRLKYEGANGGQGV
jgi:hypothetical protein